MTALGGGAELGPRGAGTTEPSPEHLVGDVLVCDPTVRQILVPHGIQRVPLSLCFELIGLRCGEDGSQDTSPRPSEAEGGGRLGTDPPARSG